MSDFLDFRINEGGDPSKSLVSIKIPKVCCGCNISVVYSLIPNTSDYLFTLCMKHMSSHTDIWNYFFVNKIHIIPDAPLRCIRCNNTNEYATKENCRKDGTYICRSCISYLYWDCKVPEEKSPSNNGEIPLVLEYVFI
jgi:hypothetical protein